MRIVTERMILFFIFLVDSFACTPDTHTHTQLQNTLIFHRRSYENGIKTQWFLLSFRNAAPKMISILMVTNHIKILFQRLLLNGIDRYGYILIHAKKAYTFIHRELSKQLQHYTHITSHHITCKRTHNHNHGRGRSRVDKFVFILANGVFLLRIIVDVAAAVVTIIIIRFLLFSLFVNVIIVVDVSLFNRAPCYAYISSGIHHLTNSFGCLCDGDFFFDFCDKTWTERIASNQCQ